MLGAPESGVPPLPYSRVETGLIRGGAITALLGSRAIARCACGICAFGARGGVIGPRAINVVPFAQPPVECSANS